MSVIRKETAAQIQISVWRSPFSLISDALLLPDFFERNEHGI